MVCGEIPLFQLVFFRWKTLLYYNFVGNDDFE